MKKEDAAQRYVLGMTHVDIGWKKSREEMAEVFDAYVCRLLDLLDTHEDFCYLLEQALHLKDLKGRRPDLFERIRRYVGLGRLEFATGLASTVENNTINGECFVRNMQLGKRFIFDHFGQAVENCAMVDTFGFPPSMPQLLRQFGHPWMMATRLGGTHTRDTFSVCGIDGTRLVVFGKDFQTPYMCPGHLNFRFVQQYSDIDALFQEAEENPSPLQLVMPYSENEVVPLAYAMRRMREGERIYRFTSLNAFMQKLMADLPDTLCSADLNPEFTGTYSLRHRVHQLNRQAEETLLLAEKAWGVYGGGAEAEQLQALWWEMFYIQFHDILTGSHPTCVYKDCTVRLQGVMKGAKSAMAGVLPAGRAQPGCYAVFSALPWPMWQEVRLPVPDGLRGAAGLLVDGNRQSHWRLEDGQIVLQAVLPPMGCAQVELLEGPWVHSAALPEDKGQSVRMENEFLLVELGGGYMIKRAVHKPTGMELMGQVDDLLVLQRDAGNFQIEEPTCAPIACGALPYGMISGADGTGQWAKISGAFPEMEGHGTEYEIMLRLPKGQPYLDLRIKVDWHMEAARLRLKIPFAYETRDGLYEVPFGAARRKPYGITRNSRGEWPVHRFVAVDEVQGRCGVALLNRGTVGAEVMGDAVYATLLRAPKAEYAGMVKDDTSSDHGTARFDFRLYAYGGAWQQAHIAHHAQGFNQPAAVVPGQVLERSAFVAWQERGIILSAIKGTPQGRVAIRMYESCGMPTECTLRFACARDVDESDVNEQPGACLGRGVEELALGFSPYEIKTLLV